MSLPDLKINVTAPGSCSGGITVPDPNNANSGLMAANVAHQTADQIIRAIINISMRGDKTLDVRLLHYVTKTHDGLILNREDISDLLAMDATDRKPGSHGMVFTIETLCPFRRLRTRIPYFHFNEIPEVKRAENDMVFGERLLTHAPFLAGFEIKSHGLLLAGGAASKLLMHTTSKIDDFDFFLVGHDAQSAEKAIMEFGDHLARFFAGHLTIYRTYGCITFVGGREEVTKYKIQVILRLYQHPMEVIRGFDMGSSSVAWDGHEVTMTLLGRFAAEYGANILNLEIRRPSYERRLIKYLGRGYDLILPDFNLHELAHAGGFVGMPYMHARTNCRGDSAAIIVYSIEDYHPNYSRSDTKEDQIGQDLSVSGYAGWSTYIGDSNLMEYNAIAVCRTIAKGGTDLTKLLCAAGTYVPGKPLTDYVPTIDQFAWKIKCRTIMFPSLNLARLKLWMGDKNAKDFITARLDEVDCMHTYSYSQKLHNMADAMIVDRYDEVQGMLVPIPLTFGSCLDGTALIGSATVSAEEWYGSYHHGMSQLVVPRDDSLTF